MKTILLSALSASLLALAAPALAADDARIAREVSQTDYYLKQFEREVDMQRGGEKMVWRTKREALERVKASC